MMPQRKNHRLDSFYALLGTVDIPIVIGVFILVSAIVMPFVLVSARRKAKRELVETWRLADQLGYTGADLKRLSGRSDFGAIDWSLTRPGTGQSIAPSLETIQLVHDRLIGVSKPNSVENYAAKQV